MEGSCICPTPPERQVCATTGMTRPIVLDHRCPQHGEKAQPRLWGRHRDLQLIVTLDEWKSLGLEPSAQEAWLVVYEDTARLPETFTGAGAREAAYRRYQQAQQSWSCHLFRRVEGTV